MTFEEWFGANMHKMPGKRELYRPLYEDAYEAGYDEGWDDGYADGYDQAHDPNDDGSLKPKHILMRNRMAHYLKAQREIYLWRIATVVMTMALLWNLAAPWYFLIILLGVPLGWNMNAAYKTHIRYKRLLDTPR